MPLNYSKWDQLELSDDSDIEGHPNVDHKSLVRWKQRDIHEKREMRKQRIAKLTAEIACNEVLQPRIEAFHQTLASGNAQPSTSAYFNQTVERLQKNPSPEAPPTNAPNQPTYEAMMLSLLLQVSEAAKEKVGSVAESERQEKLAKALTDGLGEHVVQLKDTTEMLKKDLAAEVAEQKKHITSDDIHDGFTSKYVPPIPEPPPVPTSKVIEKERKKATTTEVEVLNPKSLAASSSNPPAGPSSSSQDTTDDPDDALPEMTPSLEAFSKMPFGAYEQSYEFIKSHRDVVVAGASDALLVAAFRAQSAGKSKYAKQCVHQSLLLQYCEKLGKDGVGVFFKKMMAGDKRADHVFVSDVESTYSHLVSRVKASQEEEAAAGGKEQIQLVPENPDQTITFNVPSGPPPEEIVLEGPGTEDLDKEEVRKALQFKWDVFESFPDNLKEALKQGTLDGVNKVLGDMEIEEAEQVVQSLDMAGILNFAEGGIRDETGKGAQ